MIVEANRQWQYQENNTQLLLPWYTLPCLEWLKKQHVYDWNVFEFGCGYSSIWWRANAHSVTSIDANLLWAKAMNAVWLGDKKEYVTFIEQIKFQYDCIVIDGDWREECVSFAISALKKGGYLIIDNWESENFDPKLVASLIKDWPIQIFKQPNHSSWCTAVLGKP